MVAWNNIVLRDDEGRIIGTLSSGQDITYIKQSEKELRINQERLRRMVDILQS